MSARAVERAIMTALDHYKFGMTARELYLLMPDGTGFSTVTENLRKLRAEALVTTRTKRGNAALWELAGNADVEDTATITSAEDTETSLNSHLTVSRGGRVLGREIGDLSPDVVQAAPAPDVDGDVFVDDGGIVYTGHALAPYTAEERDRVEAAAQRAAAGIAPVDPAPPTRVTLPTGWWTAPGVETASWNVGERSYCLWAFTVRIRTEQGTELCAPRTLWRPDLAQAVADEVADTYGQTNAWPFVVEVWDGTADLWNPDAQADDPWDVNGGYGEPAAVADRAMVSTEIVDA